MRFHTFGDGNKKIMVLIHGVLTPWQIWQEHAKYYEKDYLVVVPALDGHVEEEASEYISVEDEANKIIDYVINAYGKEVDVLCGLSMGGAVAYKVFESGKLTINNLVVDGAPLSPLGKLPVWFMTKNYMNIIHKTKVRDQKTLDSFKKYFLPEEYLPSFLKFADTMTDETIKNMLSSVFSTNISKTPVENDTKILFMHGTKGNEVVSKKAARKMKEVYPQTVIKCFDGYAHAELSIYHVKEWIDTVKRFIIV